MNDIVNSDNCKQIRAINKGWSSDKKFYVETAEDEAKIATCSGYFQV